MTPKEYEKWCEERARRAGPVMEKADALKAKDNPCPIAIWAMDGVLRTVLHDIHWYWVKWSYFREIHGVSPNYSVIEGWEPDE